MRTIILIPFLVLFVIVNSFLWELGYDQREIMRDVRRVINRDAEIMPICYIASVMMWCSIVICIISKYTI